MILSIDRVLQLLAEGKSIELIAEKASLEVADVASIIEEARVLLGLHEKQKSRKKVIIRKKEMPGEVKPNDDFLAGAELNAIHVESSMVVFTAGTVQGNQGPAGIGIVIIDDKGRQVGKVSRSIGIATRLTAEYRAVVIAIELARYFNVKKLSIRTDSELVVKQLSGEYKPKDGQQEVFRAQIINLMKGIADCQIELISRSSNEKAVFLAQRSLEI